MHKRISQLVEQFRSLLEPRPVLERGRMVRNAGLPGYGITIRLKNLGIVLIDIVKVYAIIRFKDGEEFTDEWPSSSRRLRRLEAGRTTTIQFAVESWKAQRITWPAAVEIGVCYRQRLVERWEVMEDLRVAIDPGSTRWGCLVHDPAKVRRGTLLL